MSVTSNIESEGKADRKSISARTAKAKSMRIGPRQKLHDHVRLESRAIDTPNMCYVGLTSAQYKKARH
jgi:hypothetical protein